MNKNFFAFLCACIVVTCAMAAPRPGVRILAAEVLPVEWNNAELRPAVDEASFNAGWKIQLSQSSDENVLILSGLCDKFNIPVHVDYGTNKAWIETSTPLDGYSDNGLNGQFKGNVERVIYALPEQWLLDGEANMNTDIYGSIYDDGSIVFDGGIIFLVSESTTSQDRATSSETSETAWMSSPLFRNVCLLVPNAIHQFTLVSDPVNSEAVAPAESTSGSEQGYMASFNVKKTYKDAVITERVFNPGTAVINGGKKHKPKDPGDANTCGFGDFGNLAIRGSNGGGMIYLPSIPFPNNDDDDGFIWVKDVWSGKKPIVPREARPCGGGGNFAIDRESISIIPNHGGLFARPSIPFPDGPGIWVALDTLSAGKRIIVKDPNRPGGCGGGGFEEDGYVGIGTMGGQVSLAPAVSNDGSNGDSDITAGKKVDPKNPKTPKPCSDPFIWNGNELLGAQFPTRFGRTPEVASNKPATQQFDEPVYVFQNPDDNTIMVYNLFGSGCVMNYMDIDDGTVTPESITWGITVPCDMDGDISYHFDSNVLFYTDGTKFTVPTAAGSIIAGDLSDDGKLNIADVTEMIDLLLTAGEQGKATADVDEDGKLHIADVTTLIDTLLHNAD